MTKPGRIIFLNGTSSSGKTSIVRAFQEIVDEPYMHLSIDLFLQTIPQRFWDSPNAGGINGVFHNAVTGYHHCMVTLARAVTADTALRLARYFGTSTNVWMRMQARYDLEVAEENLAERVAREVKVYRQRTLVAE